MLENKECVPFEDMTVEEQGIIINAIKNGVKIEECYGKGSGWFYPVLEGIRLKSSYRIIPKRLNIPWYAIKDELCYAVLTRSGAVFLSDKKFLWDVYIDMWRNADGSLLGNTSCLKIDTKGIDYKTSQVSRFD